MDFTLSNARRFYSSMGKPLDGKGLSFIPLELFLKELRNNIAWVLQTDFTASHKGIEKFKQQRRLTQRKFLKTTALFERQEIIVLQVWHAL